MNYNAETISKRIQVAREKVGIPQKEIALKIGIPRNSFSRIELGTATPKADVLMNIATELNVSLDWLMGRGNETEIVSFTKKEDEQKSRRQFRIPMIVDRQAVSKLTDEFDSLETQEDLNMKLANKKGIEFLDINKRLCRSNGLLVGFRVTTELPQPILYTGEYFIVDVSDRIINQHSMFCLNSDSVQRIMNGYCKLNVINFRLKAPNTLCIFYHPARGYSEGGTLKQSGRVLLMEESTLADNIIGKVVYTTRNHS